MKNKCLFTLFLLSFAMFSGCLYKMPKDDYMCTSPHTNNPHITGDKGPSLFPTKG